jgi:phytoene/squalene synthetase
MDWSKGSDLYACAQMVEQGDADRFASAMAAPVAARAVLFPIYAFNLEISKIPFMTAEPMLAQMRYQWWLDALGALQIDGTARRHQVLIPLAQVLKGQGIDLVLQIVQARQADLERAPFTNRDALVHYLDHTSGSLMQLAYQSLGGSQPQLARDLGRALGAARYLQALPQLQAQGRTPLPPDTTPQDLTQIGKQALIRARAKRLRNDPGFPALQAAALCGPLLHRTKPLSQAHIRARRLSTALTRRF